MALTHVFGADRDKQAQWRAFLQKSQVRNAPPELIRTVNAIGAFLGPIVLAAQSGPGFAGRWVPSGGWRPTELP